MKPMNSPKNPSNNQDIDQLFDELYNHLENAAQTMQVLKQKVGTTQGAQELHQVHQLLVQATHLIKNYLDWLKTGAPSSAGQKDHQDPFHQENF